MWGKPPAWEGEFVAYFDSRRLSYVRIAYTILGDWQAAEDATQNAFVALYGRWPRIRPETLDAYAKRTLVNKCLSALRKNRREMVTDAVPDRAQRHQPEVAVNLRRALQSLSPRVRAIVTLRYLEDMSVGEVAAVLNVPTGTVKSQAKRALDQLRDHATPSTDQASRGQW